MLPSVLLHVWLHRAYCDVAASGTLRRAAGAPLGIWVQPIQASPYTQDLQAILRYIPSRFPAFPTCYCSLCLSTPGKSAVLGGPLLSTSYPFWGNLPSAYAAHNQIHITYQSHFNSDGSVRDAVLSTVEYDDPGCHNATTRCSTWNPKVKILFTASRVVPNSQLTNSDCRDWPGTNSYRCDDPIDQSGSGGLPVPKVLNSYALLNAQVQVNGNLLREYQFSYQQGHSHTITDPASGKADSIAGFFDLTKIDELGTNGTALNA